MRGYVLELFVALFVGVLMFGACVAVSRVAHADTPALSDAGPGSGSGSGSAAAPAPSDKLHDAVDDPLAAVDDVRAAKNGGGWALAVLAALVILFRGLAKISTVYQITWLAFLAKGKVAVGLACLGAGSAAAFNALAFGGNAFAVVWAGIGAGLALIAPAPKPAGG